MGNITNILCGVDRPESILTWKRSPTVRALLTGLSCGDIPLSHDGLDAGRNRQVSHLRSLLEHNGLLRPRDEHLGRFEVWLARTLDDIADPAVRAPVEQFATWHHLPRLRLTSTPGQASDGPKRLAQQQITETIKFLTWLHHTHQRTAASCHQQDVDEWLATGPTTRHKIRAFFAWAKKSKINTAVRLESKQAQTTGLLTQDQRLLWIKKLLTGDTQSLPHRVAVTLVLLYAQPMVKIAALKTTAVDITPHETLISLGAEPIRALATSTRLRAVAFRSFLAPREREPRRRCCCQRQRGGCCGSAHTRRLLSSCRFPLLIASRRWLQLGFSKLSQGDSTLFCLTDGCIS